MSFEPDMSNCGREQSLTDNCRDRQREPSASVAQGIWVVEGTQLPDWERDPHRDK